MQQNVPVGSGDMEEGLGETDPGKLYNVQLVHVAKELGNITFPSFQLAAMKLGIQILILNSTRSSMRFFFPFLLESLREALIGSQKTLQLAVEGVCLPEDLEGEVCGGGKGLD